MTFAAEDTTPPASHRSAVDSDPPPSDEPSWRTVAAIRTLRDLAERYLSARRSEVVPIDPLRPLSH